jgi:acetyltransferase
VLEAAFRRCGVLRVANIADLFYMAEVLSKQPRPQGPRLTIVTNAGGPGVLATDALIMGGGELAELSPEAIDAFNAVLPATWSHANPVDIIGDASPERYAKALEIAAKDPNSDGMLVILTPQAMTDPTQIAEELKPLAKQEGKPLLASWMGGVDVAAGEAILNRANIPTFPYPDTAARAFNYMWQYSYNLRGLYETPALAEDSPDWTPDRALVAQIVQTSRDHGRTILTESESKQVLAAYGRHHHCRRCRSRGPGRCSDRLSGGAQTVLGDHHPQDRCRRRAAQFGQRSGRRECLRGDSDFGVRKGRRGAFSGRHRAAHGPAQGCL